MKKEQIEKAANAYIDDFLNDHIDYTIINNEEDNYEAGRNHALYEFGADIFKAGVEWCTNSVWHDASEQPKRNKVYLVQMGKDDFDTFYDSENWKSFSKDLNMVRWAYIEDLLPNKE